MDDIVVHSKTFDEHLKVLDTTLETLYNANLRIKLSKCCFAYREIKLLGFRVSGNGISTDPDKVRGITEFPRPRNVKDVRAYLGSTGYYRTFVKDYAKIASPLHNLLKIDTVFKWTGEHEEAFRELKTKLTSSPCLRHFSASLPIVVSCDASNYGIGATLANVVNKKEQPIAYVSRALNKCEKNYTTMEKECLAAIFALKKFRHLLLGRRFKILTDNSALCYLKNLKDPQSRLARWAIALADYDFEICYKKGKTHLNADGLSRYPADPAPEDMEADVPSVFSTDVEFDIRQLQKEDNYCRTILKQISDGETEKSNFLITDNVLYRRFLTDIGEEHLLVLPHVLVNRVLENLHDSSLCGHLGIAKTWQRIKCRYFRPGLRSATIRYVTSCELCQRRKDRNHKKYGFLQTPRFSNKMNEIVGIDCVGPLPETPRKNRFIIVAVDHATRYVQAEAVPDIKAERIAQFLFTNYILKYGIIRYLVSDRGTNFTSKVVNNLLNLMTTRHVLTSSYHPESNGIVERVNRPLKAILTMYVNHMQHEWDLFLNSTIFAINTSTNESTGYAPHFLMYGQMPDLPIDDVLPTNESVTPIHRAARLIKTFRKKAKQRLLFSHLKNKKIFDTHRKEHNILVGDLVWRKRGQTKTGETPKLSFHYDGPFMVIHKYGDNSFLIMNCDPETNARWRYDTVAADRLKAYVERTKADLPTVEPTVQEAGESSSSESGVANESTCHQESDQPLDPPIHQEQLHPDASSDETIIYDPMEASPPEDNVLHEPTVTPFEREANISPPHVDIRRSSRLQAKPRVSYARFR